MAHLRKHDVVLEGQTKQGVPIRLRPLAEGDWDLLFRWNNDPQVLYYAEGDDVTARTMAEVQDLYYYVCRLAFCFIIEASSRPVGECWLQEMNLERVLSRHPGRDCRRIDLMIGETAAWEQGIGTEVIRLLTWFGFAAVGADEIYGCDVADYNVRSRRAFERVGYVLVAENPQPPGAKAGVTYDLVLSRSAWARGWLDVDARAGSRAHV
jgi:RimJ/RimL family protein N-acetyltransferase